MPEATPATSCAAISSRTSGAMADSNSTAAKPAIASLSMRHCPTRSMWRARNSALAAVPRPKAEAAIMTVGTPVPSDAATAGAIGPRLSELQPITPMQLVRT